MAHYIEIRTCCEGSQHRGHRQTWSARCHCGCGWYGAPSTRQATIETEAAFLIRHDGGTVVRPVRR